MKGSGINCLYIQLLRRPEHIGERKLIINLIVGVCIQNYVHSSLRLFQPPQQSDCIKCF